MLSGKTTTSEKKRFGSTTKLVVGLTCSLGVSAAVWHKKANAKNDLTIIMTDDSILDLTDNPGHVQVDRQGNVKVATLNGGADNRYVELTGDLALRNVPFVDDLVSMFSGEGPFDAATSVWTDITGNGHDSKAQENQGVRQVEYDFNGVTRQVLRGPNNKKGTVAFDADSNVFGDKRDEVTIFYVARYATNDQRRRIFDSSNNWLSGFHNTHTGVAHHCRWLSGRSGYHLAPNDWFVARDTKTTFDAWANGKKINAADGHGCAPNVDLTIGGNGEWTKDWEVASFMVYNRILSKDESRQVLDYLNTLYDVTPSIDY